MASESFIDYMITKVTSRYSFSNTPAVFMKDLIEATKAKDAENFAVAFIGLAIKFSFFDREQVGKLLEGFRLLCEGTEKETDMAEQLREVSGIVNEVQSSVRDAENELSELESSLSDAQRRLEEIEDILRALEEKL